MAVENIDFKINALIDAGKAATTLGELRTNLKQLSDLAAEVGPNNVAAFNKITTAAGETRDRVKDIKESVTALAGTPMERLTNGFGRLRQAIFELDFDKFKQSLLQIKDGALALGTQLAAPFTNAGKAIYGLITGTETLTVAMTALGGAIKATGIGALVAGVILLVANFDKLKDSGGLIGKTFQAVANVMSTVLEYLEKIGNRLGLIDTESKKFAEKYQQEAKDRKAQVDLIVDEQKRIVAIVRKRYEDEKALREANRRQVFKDQEEEKKAKEKYRIEDLEAEKMYYRTLLEVSKQRNEVDLKSLQDKIRAQAKLYQQPEPTFEGGKVNIKSRQGETKIMTMDDIVTGGYSIGKTESEIDKERFDEFKRTTQEYIYEYQKRAAADRKFKESSAEIAREANTNLIRIDNQLKDAQLQIAIDGNKKISNVDESQNRKDLEREQRHQKALYDAMKKRFDAAEELTRTNREKLQSLEQTIIAGEPEPTTPEAKIAKTREDRLSSLQLQFVDTVKGMSEDSDEYSQALDLFRQGQVQAESEYSDSMLKVQADKYDKEKVDAENALNYQKASAQEKLYYQQQIAFQGLALANQVNDMLYQSDSQRAAAQLELERNSAAFKAEARKKGLTEEQLYQQKLVETQNEVNRKQFNRNKALQIASAVVNTASAIAQINAQPLVNADISQTLRTTLSALVAAVGAAQIATIASAKYQPDAIPNTPVTPTSGITATETVTPAQFTVGEFKKGQFVDQRVYVVESDVTGIQRKVRVIENRSKF